MHRMTCKPGGKDSKDLAIDERIRLAQLVPPFTVAENDVLATGIREHRRTNFAGERTFFFVVGVLCTERDGIAAAAAPFTTDGQNRVRKRRADGHAHTRVLRRRGPSPRPPRVVAPTRGSCTSSQLPATQNFVRMVCSALHSHEEPRFRIDGKIMSVISQLEQRNHRALPEKVKVLNMSPLEIHGFGPFLLEHRSVLFQVVRPLSSDPALSFRWFYKTIHELPKKNHPLAVAASPPGPYGC